MEQQTPKKITKKKIFAIIGAIIVAYVGYELYQMNKGGHYKFLLQTELDREYRDSGRGSFCYKVGHVKLPCIEKGYPTEYLTQRAELGNDASRLWAYPNYYKYENLYRLHIALPIFYKIGLLTRQPVEGTDYYQYDISDEGKKYQSEYDDNLVFCYGYQKVLEITDVINRDSMTYQGKKEIVISYNYELNDVPDWVINKDFIELFSNIVGFNSTTIKEDLKNGSAKETFIEKNGNIYIDGSFNSYIRTSNVNKYLNEK